MSDQILPADERLVVDARRQIMAGIDARACPAAVIEVGRCRGAEWREAFGRLTYEMDAPACTADTIFDLASLTKVIATTSIAMQLASQGRLSLEQRLADILPGWRAGAREDIRIRHLLEHSSGLPAQAPLWKHASGPEAFELAIAAVPLEQPPAVGDAYSDLGFIVLGRALERLTGESLAALAAPILEAAGDYISFQPPPELRPRIAPTEINDRAAGPLRGEVHDDNAAAMGGVAAHAGLFGTARSVGAFARLVLRTFHESTLLGPPAWMRRFATRSDVPGSSRALGWDTMLPTSSCGTLMSPTAIGHTGYTGTSLWIDVDRDLYVVLLSNRVHPSREPNRFAPVRPRVHDAIVSRFGLS